MQSVSLKIEKIYIPAKRRKTLDTAIVDEIAESLLEEGQLTSIMVRQGRGRLVLVEGLHRHQPVTARRTGFRLLQSSRHGGAMDQGRQERHQVDTAVNGANSKNETSPLIYWYRPVDVVSTSINVSGPTIPQY
jgi:sulfiredoxin